MPPARGASSKFGTLHQNVIPSIGPVGCFNATYASWLQHSLLQQKIHARQEAVIPQ